MLTAAFTAVGGDFGCPFEGKLPGSPKNDALSIEDRESEIALPAERRIGHRDAALIIEDARRLGHKLVAKKSHTANSQKYLRRIM